MFGILNVALVDERRPSFLVSYFIEPEGNTYLHLLNYKSLNSDYVNFLNYDTILPNSSLPSPVVQIELIPRYDLGLIVLVYRKECSYRTVYFSAYDITSKKTLTERVAATNLAVVTGANELLRCRSKEKSDLISCIMIVEGNSFSELVFRIENYSEAVVGGPGAQPGQAADFWLRLNYSKTYKHYLNSQVERIDFSDKIIVLQTVAPFLDQAADNLPSRHMLIYRRDTPSPHLYRGVPCSDYSEFCQKPLDVIFDSGEPLKYLVNSEKNNYLIMHFLVKNRTFWTPATCKLTFPEIQSLVLAVSNPIKPQTNAQYVLASVIRFEKTKEKETLNVNWFFGLCMYSVLLLAAAYSVWEENKHRAFRLVQRQHSKTLTKQPGQELHTPMLRRQNSDESSQGMRSISVISHHEDWKGSPTEKAEAR